MAVKSLGVAAACGCLFAFLAGPAGAARFDRAAQPFAYIAPPAGSRALFALSYHPTALMQVDRSRRTAALMRRSGGTLVSPALNVWRLRSGVAQQLTPALERAGALSVVEPERKLSFLGRLDGGHLDQGDPLLPQEWWIHAIGADTSEPPGPGVPVTDVDSGLDLTHQEFASRLDTTAMNPQTIVEDGGWHGTAVSSVAAAPANGLGVVGVYPQAAYRMWDASPNGELTNKDEIQGILSTAALGPGVINLSLGAEGRDALEAQAVLRAFGAGSLVVAAAGNSGDQGNPLEFPASLPHVLTVSATGENNAAVGFSSSSPAVDMAAPGVDIPVAVPLAEDPTGYFLADGTSFAAPLVSGAAAWVATLRPGLHVTQLFQLMRGTATDLAPAGHDNATGFGLLNIPAALAAPLPPKDLQEPNEDIFAVRANGLFRTAKSPLVNGAKRSASVTGTMDFTEDPEDVYRIVVPARSTVTVTMTPTANLSLGLWGPKTRTVFETGAGLKRDLLRSSTRPGTSTERIVYTNKLHQSTALYVDLWIGKGLAVRNASYSLRIVARKTA